MVFTTHIFLFYFLPLFLLVCYLLPFRFRNLWIAIASYFFYGWWQPWFVCLMMFTTVMDFIWGKVITRPGATRAQQRLAVTARYTPYRIIILAVCSLLVFQPLQAHDWAERPQTWGRAAVLAPLFALCVVVMFGQSFNPFLYFQF